jgi:hypothetical protein
LETTVNTPRSITLSLALGAMALSPAAALARNGADDHPNVPDNASAQRADHRSGGNKATSVVGTCSRSSTSKLKVKPDDARLETEFEVDQNRNGVTWKVTLRRNGHLASRTNATTRAPSGSFSVERRLTNGSGRDTITAKATSPSGEVCTATITV